MANMSYCRFENTLRDLHDCCEHMDDELSDSERFARVRLINLAVDIALDHGDEVGRDVEEVEE